MRHITIVAALVIASSASAAFTRAAQADWWTARYRMNERSGYCNGGLWTVDVRYCPENRSVTTSQLHKRNASKPGRTEFEVERSLFPGNESRLTQFGWVDFNCRSPRPDVRVVKQPAKGNIRFEETAATVLASKSAVQKKCFGKPVSATALYYRAGEKSEGRDKVIVDADTKLGYVIRYIISIDVRAAADAEAKAQQTGPAQQRVARSVLKGNETRLAAPNYLNADCSSGPLPDLRVIAAPKNGAYRTEETSVAAERPANNSRAACNGKPVNAVAVYYKPTDEFAGSDEMVIDVDYHDGNVRRFVYAITVR
jgi:hypothetical protein